MFKADPHGPDNLSLNEQRYETLKTKPLSGCDAFFFLTTSMTTTTMIIRMTRPAAATPAMIAILAPSEIKWNSITERLLAFNA